MGWVRCADIVGGYQKAYFGTLIPNTYINKADGSAVSYNGWSATDYLEVVGGKETVICQVSSNDEYNVFYDENKTFISKFYYADRPITIPQNAKYMRVSAHNQDISPTSYYFNYANKTEPDLIPIPWDNVVTNIQRNRQWAVNGLSASSIRPVSDTNYSLGVIAVPVDVSDGSNVIVVKYDLCGYFGINDTMFNGIFFSNTNDVSNLGERSGLNFVKRLDEATLGSGETSTGHMDVISVPYTIPENLYIKMCFGWGSFSSIKLFKTKI